MTGQGNGGDGLDVAAVGIANRDLAVRVRDEGLRRIEDVPEGPIRAHHVLTTVSGNVAVRKAVRKALVEHFRPAKQAIDRAKDAIVALERTFLDPLDRANDADEARMVEFRREQERIAAEERRRLQEIADAKAAEERRLDAIRAEEEGDASMADAIRNTPPEPRQVRAAAAPVLATRGTHFVETWKAAEDVDVVALCRYVAANPGQANLVKANMTALNALARAVRAESSIPGVRFEKSTGVAATRGNPYARGISQGRED